jgi:4,5-dihydroxyphthalate decarboxylase
MSKNVAESLALKTVIGSYGHTKPLKDGDVSSGHLQLNHTEVSPVHDVFPRIVGKESEFEVAELALTTYLLAKTFNKNITAIPVVLQRMFWHGNIFYNANSGIEKPSDLAGKRVGIRSYGQTGGVWTRGVLQSEYGIDLDSITWVLVEPEHVREFEPKGNIEFRPGASISDMILSGDIDAAIGRVDQIAGQADPGTILPLIPDSEAIEREWFNRTGIFPTNHTLVIRNDVLEANPWVAQELFDVLKESKQVYLNRLERDGPSTGEDKIRLWHKDVVGGDPLPFGVEKNRKSLETLAEFAFNQRIVPKKFDVEEMFFPGTLKLE